MKQLFSVFLFFAFMVLCAWEVGPKFYELAVQDIGGILYVAETKQKNLIEQKNGTEKESQEVDYQKLIQDINTDGA